MKKIYEIKDGIEDKRCEKYSKPVCSIIEIFGMDNVERLPIKLMMLANLVYTKEENFVYVHKNRYADAGYYEKNAFASLVRSAKKSIKDWK